MEKNRKTEIRTEVKRRRAEASPELLHAASIRIKDSFIKQQAYEEALRYFYYTMNRRLKTDFTIVSSFDSPWKFNSFGELIKAEGIDEVVQIVAENVPSVYLIEEQRKRLGEL